MKKIFNNLTPKKNKKIKKVLPGLALAIFIPLISMAASNTIDKTITSDSTGSEAISSTDNGRPEKGDKKDFTNLTDKEKATMEAEREARQAEMEAKNTAIKTAIEASDYDAWVEAIGSDNQITQKITADNFSSYVEAYNLQEQAKTILSDLGLEGNMGMGFGGDMDHGDRGFGPGDSHDNPPSTNQSNN